MAESTLSVGYDQIQIEVGRFLGYSITAATQAAWIAANPDKVAQINRYIQAGYRQFLYPPAIEGIEVGYEWSFLKPTTTIDTHTPYSTGTVTVVTTTCTLTGGTWPTWLTSEPEDAVLTIDETVYTVVSRDNGTQLTVSASGDVAGEDYTLTSDGTQDLPDDFGRIIGDLHFEADVCNVSVPVVSEHKMQTLLQQSIDESRPQYAAVRFKTDDGTGQRQEILWWPIPDDTYEMTYRYEAFTGKIAAGEYCVGGMKHSEVILESCLAIAEQRADDDKGLHWDAFTRLLMTAVAQDRKNGARYFGSMSKGEETEDGLARRRYYGGSYDVTYKGSTL